MIKCRLSMVRGFHAAQRLTSRPETALVYPPLHEKGTPLVVRRKRRRYSFLYDRLKGAVQGTPKIVERVRSEAPACLSHVAYLIPSI